MRALESADELRLPIRTVSHPDTLADACRGFDPNAAVVVVYPDSRQVCRAISAIATLRPDLPVLVAGETDISRTPDLLQNAVPSVLDMRGSVRLDGGVRDLQLALLCAASRLYAVADG